MCAIFRCIFFVVFVFVEDSIASNSTIYCSSEPECQRCGPSGCVKCSEYIVYPTRHCVSTCPSGYAEKWSSLIDFMGKMCVHSGYIGGLSGAAVAVIVGIICGALICGIIIIGGIVYLRHKKRRALKEGIQLQRENFREQQNYMHQLEVLAPHAQTFLDMLNDARRQLREMHNAGDNTAACAYKPIIRDLAKILLLLNRPIEKLLSVPEDWEQLFNWAEKLLRRHSTMNDITQSQITQFVNYLESPVSSNDSIRHDVTMSTFKPARSAESVFNMRNHVDRTNKSGDDHLQWQFNYTLISPKSVSAQWLNSRERLNSSCFLEDDFFQLGFRPQDEITTEL